MKMNSRFRASRLIFSALAILLASIAFAHAQTAANSTNGRMTDEDRSKLIKYLKDSEQQLLSAIENLSDAQWRFKPAADRWSVGEVAEHIYLSEALLFSAAERALASRPNPDWEEKTKGKTEFIERVMVGRMGKAQAPEQIVPSGKLSRDELVARYKETRAKTLKFAETTDLPLKSHTADHPFPVFGTLNAYQWVIYIPLHNIRHNQQIAEVKAHPDYPKK